MTRFVPGLQLARAFYTDAVAPLLDDVEHSAALLGYGSDVIGFDTERSTDHGWGPRLQLFVERERVGDVRHSIDAGLPEEFGGWSTRYGWDDVPVSHHVEVVGLGDWLRDRLGFDPRRGVSVRQWLSTPQQILLEVTAGAVFHDPLGELAAVREALRWYPDDVWLWLLACQWRRIDQEEPFVGRAAEVRDELGSRVIATRLVRDAIRLAFLLERRYAPYSKWLGSAFGRLDASETLGPLLLDAVSGSGYAASLVSALEELGARHNALGITRPVDATSRLFHSRPFRVLGAARFADACLERVKDPLLRSLPLVGGVDQFVDAADVLSDSRAFVGLSALFDAWAT